MRLGISPLTFKIVLESSPLQSTMLVGRLGVVLVCAAMQLPRIVRARRYLSAADRRARTCARACVRGSWNTGFLDYILRKLPEVSGDVRKFLQEQTTIPVGIRGKPLSAFAPVIFRRKPEPVPRTQVLFLHYYTIII